VLLSMQVCAYRAGHVLGAAMFMVEIGGMKLLYTGDYSRLADRHLSAADLPESTPDIGDVRVYPQTPGGGGG
jgi:cleavage and polyadenylation specificity factor subunit 3